MTRQGAPTPPPPPPMDTEYVRKLALAILSTLQSKGLLSAGEVDSILIAARRAAQESRPGSQSAAGQEQKPPSRSVEQVTVQPSPPPGSLSWQVVVPPAGEEVQASPRQEGESKPEGGEAHPPVMDFKLD